MIALPRLTFFGLLTACCVAVVPVGVRAQNAFAIDAQQSLPGPYSSNPSPIVSARPNIVGTLRGGVSLSPAYLGSDESKVGANVGFRLNYLRLPGGFEIGSADANGYRTGFGLRGSLRILRKRNSSDYAEIDGLDDVPLAIEGGFGLDYQQRNYRVFANLRYGVIGHNSWTGEVGADGIVYPMDALRLSIGPRLSFGTDRFANEYFGVSNEEETRSGLSAFNADGGVLGAGIEVGARYLLNDTWGIEGAAGWERLLNDAADSPITSAGSKNQYRVRVGVTHRISLDF